MKNVIYIKADVRNELLEDIIASNDIEISGRFYPVESAKGYTWFKSQAGFKRSISAMGDDGSSYIVVFGELGSGRICGWFAQEA
jgi:hypothetical protein